MKQISINDLPRVRKTTNIIENKDGIIKLSNGDIYQLNDYIELQNKLVMPKYEDSILAITSSIKKYYGIETKFNTFITLDDILVSKKYKHIAILLLDGMGSYILKNNLDKDSFLIKNKLCDYHAVYPPTTACAIPALCSGETPIKTGWVGWSNYFSEINRFVVMFRNKDYFTDEDLNINIEKDILPYKKFYSNFPTHVFELGPSFTPSNCLSLKEMVDRYVEETKKHESSFCYMYWGEPDTTLHINGAYSNEGKMMLKDIDNTLNDMSQNISDETLLIVTADHGHIDVKPIYLANFTDLLSLLDRVPSNEGRCAFFKVKRFKKRKFIHLFNTYFGDYFTLLSKQDFIEEGYLGESCKMNYKLDSFIGDYVAIGKKNYYFNFNLNCYSENDDEMIFRSHHAGITANEMTIPFIVLKKD